jgi:hypothetical protein
MNHGKPLSAPFTMICGRKQDILDAGTVVYNVNNGRECDRSIKSFSPFDFVGGLLQNKSIEGGIP